MKQSPEKGETLLLNSTLPVVKFNTFSHQKKSPAEWRIRSWTCWRIQERSSVQKWSSPLPHLMTAEVRSVSKEIKSYNGQRQKLKKWSEPHPHLMTEESEYWDQIWSPSTTTRITWPKTTTTDQIHEARLIPWPWPRLVAGCQAIMTMTTEQTCGNDPPVVAGKAGTEDTRPAPLPDFNSFFCLPIFHE